MGQNFFDNKAEHSSAKHQILTQYLYQWFPKLASYDKQLVFIDGFAGTGTYDNGEDGSPIVALRALIDHNAFPTWKDIRFDFIFVEAEQDNFQRMKVEVEKFLSEKGSPKNVKVSYLNDKFANILDNSKIENIIHSKTPLFAFIDPFGFSATPMDVLCEITRMPKSEILLNLSMNSINRFFTAGNVAERLDELFNLSTQERLEKLGEILTDRKRPEKIREIYIEQLKREVRMQYVWSFEMRGLNNHIEYYLIFGTRSLHGLKAAKAAMWKVDPSGNFRFADRLAGQLVLFSGDNLDVGPLARELTKTFSGREVTIEEIENFTLEMTPYLDTHLRRKVLAPMEKAQKIEVTHRTGKSAFPRGTKIKFS